MRNSKEVTVAEKKVVVYELTVRQIKELWRDLTGGSPETKEKPMFSNEEILTKHWDRCIHGMKINETDDLAPSELKVIYDAFEEVNKIFFDLSLSLEGENPFIKGLRATVLSELMLRFAALSKEATGTSGNMDTASS